MSTVIEVNGLSKQYRIGTKDTKSETFIGAVRDTLMSPFVNFKKIRNLSRTGGEEDNVFWALKDVNFSVKEGEVLGVIGRNGAGKSTLLKILSRITDPTAGDVKIKGRIASLLEVGTGFHPELSGRENVYMNGTILGMTRKEIDRKFDEIVDFSGVEKFIDTPVKFYSSGMKVRLGFAVAAHLEPEILIVDEVLAVGDAEFQRKAIGKMKDVTKSEGRTVLFVSHNIAAIKSLCTTGLFLSKGVVKSGGDVVNVIDDYHQETTKLDQADFRSAYMRTETQDESFDILEAKVCDHTLAERKAFTFKDRIVIEVTYQLTKVLKGGVINFTLDNADQTIFLTFDTDLNKERLEERHPGIYRALVTLPMGIVKPGRYFVSFNTGIANFTTYVRLERCLSFEVTLADENETFISYAEKRSGIIAMPVAWETKKIG